MSRTEPGASRREMPERDPDLDDVFAAYRRPDAPGAAVGVIVDGRLELARAYGAARLDDGTRVRPATAFRLASITKQLTARAVVFLIEDGCLTLDTPIGDVVRGLPAWGDVVRVGHLLAHTAGLPHYESSIPDNRTSQLTDRDALRLAAAHPDLRSEPGSRFEYSNTGYAALAVAVEEIAGIPFSDFLDERIFRPLGMDAVAHVEGRTEVPNRAFGYREAVGGYVPADQSVTSAVLGDGGVYASVLDLARWDAALRRPGFAPDPAALAAFAAPVAEGVAYGFGWYLDTFEGRPRQRHDGWTSGFQNELQRFPDHGLTVAVLTNRAEPSPRPLVESVARTWLGR